MDEDTSRKTIPTSASLAIEQLTRAYDAQVRNFLAEKRILAVILKSCVKEFRDCSTEDLENYDLLTVMLLGLGDPVRQDTNAALGMLSAALSKRLETEEKKRILSDSYGIKMTETIERTVDYMCNLGYGILEDGRAEGLAEGIAKGRAEGRAEGRTEGGFIMLYDLVSKNIISPDIAATQANQSAEAFKAGMDKYLASKK